jgi:metal-responsive CopG/Arc/MetJ family transcriptional regulator
MKAIQITVDEGLLARLDRDPEVKRLGRSEVLRRAADAYLRRQRKRTVAEAYRLAYGEGKTPLDDLEGWDEEGVWPEA